MDLRVEEVKGSRSQPHRREGDWWGDGRGHQSLLEGQEDSGWKLDSRASVKDTEKVEHDLLSTHLVFDRCP